MDEKIVALDLDERRSSLAPAGRHGPREWRKIMRRIVGYYLGALRRLEDERCRVESPRWRQGGEPVLLWQRDAEDAAAAPLHLRRGLQQALFCLRTEIADDLWLPRPSDLPSEAQREIVLAEVRAAGARLILGDQLVTDEGLSVELAPVRQMARTATALRDTLFPRRRADHPEDPSPIGLMDGAYECARLAHKLYLDLRLTQEQIAEVLDHDEWATFGQGRRFTNATVNQLLTRYVGDLRDDTPRRTSARDWLSTKARDAVYRRGSKAAPAEATADETRTAPDPVELEEDGSLIGVGEGNGRPLHERPQLLTLLEMARTGYVRAVHLSSGSEFGGVSDREVALAHLWHRLGVPVLVEGTPLSPDNDRDAVTALLRPLAESAVRLSLALVDHDYGPLADSRRDEAFMKRRILELRRQGLSYDAVATRLEREAVPTRKRSGRWHAAAVRELEREALNEETAEDKPDLPRLLNPRQS